MMRKIALIAALLSLPSMVWARTASPTGMETYVSSSNRVVRAGWENVDAEHHLSGAKLRPEALNARVVVVHRWCIACPGIDESVRAFQSLAKQYSDTDIVFLTSYYPANIHSRAEVDSAMRRYHVTTPVYVGAAPINVPCAHQHRAMYVVKGGGCELWSKMHDNTDIASLAQYLKANKNDLLEASLRLAAEHAPGRALLEAKRMKKLDPKKAKELKDVIEPLSTPANLRMAEFEEKAAALRAKPTANAGKALAAKLAAFAKKAPEELKDEIDELMMELEK